MNIYCEPGALPRAGHLNLTITLGSRYCSYAHFMGEKTEAHTGEPHLSKLTELGLKNISLCLDPADLSRSSSLSLLSGVPRSLFSTSPASWVPVSTGREEQYKVQPYAPWQTCLSDSGAGLPDGLPPPPTAIITPLRNPPALPPSSLLQRE